MISSSCALNLASICAITVSTADLLIGAALVSSFKITVRNCWSAEPMASCLSFRTFGEAVMISRTEGATRSSAAGAACDVFCATPATCSLVMVWSPCVRVSCSRLARDLLRDPQLLPELGAQGVILEHGLDLVEL